MALMLVGATARAEPGFSWHAVSSAEGCASEGDVRPKVATILGHDPFSSARPPRGRSVLSRYGDTLVLELALEDAGGTAQVTRRLEAPAGDCVALTNAAALALALALESVTEGEPRAAAAAVPTGAIAPPVPYRGASDERGAPVRDEVPSPQTAPFLTLLAQGIWTLGLLPRPTAGVGADVRPALGARVEGAIGGRYLPAASERGEFTVGLAAAHVGLCGAPYRGGAVSVLACGAVLGGALRVANEAGTVDPGGNEAWFAAEITARAQVGLGGAWAAELGSGAVLPLARPVYTTRECPRVGFQQSLAALSVLVSAGTHFR